MQNKTLVQVDNVFIPIYNSIKAYFITIGREIDSLINPKKKSYSCKPCHKRRKHKASKTLYKRSTIIHEEFKKINN